MISYLAAFAAVLALDQALKALLWGREGVLIPGVLNIANVRNTGSAMDALPFIPAWLLSVLAAVLIFAIGAYVYRCRPSRVLCVSLGCIAGGAAGNLLDRLVRGYVADLFETVFVRFYVFNAADAAIVAGCAVCGAVLLFGGDREKEDPDGKGHDADEGA